jgi:hypothetical protein
MMVALFPPVFGNVGTQTDTNADAGLDLSQQAVSPVFKDYFVNASIRDYVRNVTVLTDSKVILDDTFTLNVIGNETEISFFNYTIPSSFAQNVHKINLYSQIGDSLGLASQNNSRDYSVFYGEEVTTYTINIEEQGFGANSTSGKVFFNMRMIAVNLMDFETYRLGQRAAFESPLVPFIPNLEIKDALIGLRLSGTQDKWDINMPKYNNSLLQTVPIRQADNLFSYTNMSRSSFSYDEGLLNVDTTAAVFTNQITLGADFDLSTVTVPTHIENAVRNVRFDPWGVVYIREEITFAHDGGDKNVSLDIFENFHILSGSLFTVDNDAVITDVYDELGSLELGESLRDEDTGYPKTTPSGIPGKQDLAISFRNGIYGGQTYSLTIEYQYNASQIISIDSDTREYTMNTTLFSDYNTTISNLEVRFVLPAGSVFVDHTYAVQSRFASFEFSTEISKNSLSSFRNLDLVFKMQEASFIDNTGFQIVFRYNGVGHLQYFASFMYVTIIILSVLVGISSLSYKPSKAIEIEKKQIPVDEMDTFFNLFSERTGAERRIAELGVQRRKGKLSKKDYDGQVQAIRKRLRALNPQLETASKKLSDKGGRYEGYVNKVMLASQRQSDTRRNMRDSKRDYDRGDIPKNIYQIRIKQFNQDLKREESTINKTLAEMVEVIQRFNQE